MQPASVARKPVELLCQRPGPQDPAVTVETHQQTVNEVRVHIAGFPVGAQIRPAQAVERDGGMPYIELALPYQPAVLRVKTGNVFLPAYPFPGSSDHIYPPVQNHRRGPADKLRTPDQILSIRSPVGDQAALRRSTGLHRTAPVRPVRCRGSIPRYNMKAADKAGRKNARCQPPFHKHNAPIVLSLKTVTIHPPVHPASLRCLH